MGQLTNLFVSESYQGLIKLTDSTTGVTGTLQYVTDGLGNNLPIQLSDTLVIITGSITNAESSSYAENALSASYAPMPDVSGFVPSSEFNSFTSSIDGRVVSLELETGSLQSQIDGKLNSSSFNSYTSSNDSKVDSLMNQTGSYATTSSLTSLSSSIATTDLGQDGRLNSLESTTSSLQNQINQKLDTGSFNTYSGDTLNLINQKLNSSSFNSYTSSNDGRVNSLEAKTGSYATTGSNVFQGTQTISGSLNIDGNITAHSASFVFLETIYQTSSVIFSSGSNILGDEPSDVQTLFGTVTLPNGPLSVTGSVDVNGVTRLTGNGGSVNLLGNSGSLVLGNNTTTPNYSNLSHISSSNNTNVNLILKDTTASASTVVSGSGNIFTNPSNAAAGMERYMSNYNAFFGGTSVPQISQSMNFSPTVNYNIAATQGSSLTFRGPDTTLSTWNAISNLFMGGQGINFGTATNPMNNISGSVQISGNILGNGTINVKGYNNSTLTGPFSITGNILNGGLANLNAFSSSINFNSNAVNASLEIDNSHLPSPGTIVAAQSPRINFNMLYGNGHRVILSGSNVNTSQTKQFIHNLLQGGFNTATLGDGDSSNIVGTAIIGNSLIVSGSSTVVNANLPNIPNDTHGSTFLGRYNSLEGDKAKTAETIFAVGTGTSSSRRTGLLIDSGSNVHVDGNMYITGALNVSNGITGSLEGTASYATQALSASYAPQDPLPSGLVSGSSQISYTGITDVPSGIISGSSQISDLGFATTSSVNTKLDTGSFNTYSGDTLNVINQKLDSGSFNSYTSSNDTKVNDLISQTGSYVTETESGSFVTNVSQGPALFDDLLIITKGDGSSYNITVNNVTNADSSSFSQTSVSSSYATNALSASYAPSVSIDTGSFATTGSNTFIGNQLINGDLNVTGALTASGLIYPIVDNGEKSFIQSDGNGNLSLQYVDTLLEPIRNGEATTLVKGTPVYVSGSLGANPIVFAADAGDPTKMPVIYIVNENILTDEVGNGILLGKIDGVDTTGYAPGTEIFVGVGGGWTQTRPTGSAIIQSLGIVTKEGMGGQGIVLNPGPANLPNLPTNELFIGDVNSYPVSKTINEIGLATTGSNTFFGDQRITGSVDIRSGNLELYSNNTIVNVNNFLTSSQSDQSNIILGWGDNPGFGGPGALQSNYTSSLTINGGNNIVSLPQIKATNFGGGTDQEGYISGSGNWIGNNFSGIYLNTGSSLFPKTTNNIIGNNSNIRLRFTTSSLPGTPPILNNNLVMGGAIDMSSNSGSFNAVASNAVLGGVILSTQNFVTNTRPTVANNNVIGAVTLNHLSSSISYVGNYNNSAVTINNALSSSIVNNLLSFSNNAIFGGSAFGTGLGVFVSGSQSTNSSRSITDNLISGRNIQVSSSFVSSSNSNLIATAIIGNGLQVIGNHTFGTNGGSAFFGRFNDTTTLHLAQDIVFAVGTGFSVGDRRTGLYVTSGSLVGVSGSLDVKGDTTITGSVNVTNSVTASFFVGDGSNLTGVTAAPADNVATTGSNIFIGNQTITGSVEVTSGITGSLEGTASYATNALTASYALNSAGGGAAFPFTGSAVITGSLTITGSMNYTMPVVDITETLTGSIDLSLSNTFLVLDDNDPVGGHLIFSNHRDGQQVSVLINATNNQTLTVQGANVILPGTASTTQIAITSGYNLFQGVCYNGTLYALFSQQ